MDLVVAMGIPGAGHMIVDCRAEGFDRRIAVVGQGMSSWLPGMGLATEVVEAQVVNSSAAVRRIHQAQETGSQCFAEDSLEVSISACSCCQS